MKKIIFMSLASLLLVGASIGGTLFFAGGQPPMEADTEVEATQDTPVGASREEMDPPIYVELDPDFVIAFQDSDQARFIKTSIQVMTRDDEITEALKLHKPVVRDGILMLLSNQKASVLATPEGKEQFRKEVLASIQNVLTEQIGKPGVEAVYFTNFVLQ